MTGINAVVTFTKIQDGGVHWHPLFGDVLRTQNEAPQVKSNRICRNVYKKRINIIKNLEKK